MVVCLDQAESPQSGRHIVASGASLGNPVNEFRPAPEWGRENQSSVASTKRKTIGDLHDTPHWLLRGISISGRTIDHSTDW
jgi:hypothetical protein